MQLTHLNSERTLACLLGLRAAILQKGPSMQPAELQCKNLLKSQIFSGGLQLLQPSNPFDEEKGEARSSTSTAGSTPTDASYQIPTTDLLQTTVGPHMVSATVILNIKKLSHFLLLNLLSFTFKQLITQRIDNLLTGLGEARLTDPLVSTWIAIAQRYCKENNLIWHQDFPPEHPISELERHITAVFIRHQSLGQLVLAVIDRELSGFTNVLPKPVSDTIKLVHQTKWTLIKTRQQLNRSYKEVCAPMLEKCRFLLYEVRPVISLEQNGLNRLNILHKASRFKMIVRRIIGEIRLSKRMQKCAKPDDILNTTIQSQNALSGGAKVQSKNSSCDNLLSNKHFNIDDESLQMDTTKINNSTENLIDISSGGVGGGGGGDSCDIIVSDCVTDEKKSNNDMLIDDAKTPTNENNDFLSNNNNNKQKGYENDVQFINNVIAKLSEQCVHVQDDAANSDVMPLIVDFILQDICDVETLRRAMYCQVQRYQIRKQGMEMFSELLNVKSLLDSVLYNVLGGYLGIFMDKPKQHYFGNILDDLNMITAYQKADLILSHSKIIEWAIGELQKFLNQEQIYAKQKFHAGKDNSNMGTYVFLKKLPRARFLLSVFGILSKDFGGNEMSLLIKSGALGSILGLLRQTGGDMISAKIGNELSYVYEDSIVRHKSTKNAATGSELAKLMKIGTRIVRGADWKWGDQDGPPPGEGRIISEVGDDGWVRVEWDNGATNSYRMGKEGQYDLRLADSSSAIVTPDTETDEDISQIEQQLCGNSHPTKLLKNACVKMLKMIAISVGQHADQMEKSAVNNMASMFRCLLSSKIGSFNLGLEHWITLGFLRAISTSKSLSKYLTSPLWINLHMTILNASITCEQDVFKKVQCLRLLQVTLINWDETDALRIPKLIEMLFMCLGKISLYCPNDLSLVQNPADIKARVLLGASHSGTIAEELIVLLRKLHTLSHWNTAINTFLSQKLCAATEILRDIETDTVQDAEKSFVVAALNVIGGYDPRPRIGLSLTHEGVRGTITSFTPKGKSIINMHNSPKIKKLSMTVTKESIDAGAFSLSRLPLNEMLLNSWSVHLYGPPEWKTNIIGNINVPLLCAQQIHLSSLNATCVLFRHQSALRKILRQRSPGLSKYSSNESVNEQNELSNRDENVSPKRKCDTTSSDDLQPESELLIQAILSRATQTNPIKSHYTYAELALAALNVSQLLASHFHTESNTPQAIASSRPIPPPVQPTLIHGVPIYNDGVFEDLHTPSSESSNFGRTTAAATSGTEGGNSSRKLAPTPIVLQIMEMGFSRKAVELALKSATNRDDSLPTADQIVQWILEHPDQCPQLPGSSNKQMQNTVNDFGVIDSDSDSGSTDTVEGSTTNEVSFFGFLFISIRKSICCHQITGKRCVCIFSASIFS